MGLYGRDLTDAVMEKDEEKVKQLLDKNADLSFKVKGDAPIHLAARFGLIRVIRGLLRHGDDANRLNEHNNTALHYAAKEGREDIVKYLIKHGAHLNAENNDGDTALHAAVGMQPMDVIERYVRLGMDVNKPNQKGETPLHHAVMYNRDESVEALLLSGADPTIEDFSGKRPDQIAKSGAIGELIRTYSLLKSAMDSGYIRSEGMRISHTEVTKPKTIERVELTIDKIDLPTDFPTTFYCRREFSENTMVKFTKDVDEEIVSDVFILRVRDVYKDLNTRLTLPVYAWPNDRQLMYVRFLMGRGDKKIITDIFDEDEKTFCKVDAVLVPETTTAIILVVEPRAEIAEVGDEAHVLNSELNPDFELDIPEGAFGQNTVISLKVFDAVKPNDETTDTEAGEDDDEDQENKDVDRTDENVNATPDTAADAGDAENGNHLSDTADKRQEHNDDGSNKPEVNRHDANNESALIDEQNESIDNAEKENVAKGRKRSKKSSKKKKKRSKKNNLMSDVYEINISGDQPSKSIKMAIPLNDLCKDISDASQLQMIRVDNVDDSEESPIKALEDLNATIVNNTVVFDADHFSMWAASIKITTLDQLMETHTEIQKAKDRVQDARFFAMLKLTEEEVGKHMLLVECVKSSSCRKRRHRWSDRDFKRQKPKHSKTLQLKPSQEYYVQLKGDARFDAKSGETGTRKLVFSPHRPSFQPFQICLIPMYKTGKASLHIYPVSDNDSAINQYGELTPADDDPEPVVILPLQLQLPPAEEPFGPEVEETFKWLSIHETEGLERQQSRDSDSDSDTSLNSAFSRTLALPNVVPLNVPKRPMTARETRTFSTGEQYPSNILPRK